MTVSRFVYFVFVIGIISSEVLSSNFDEENLRKHLSEIRSIVDEAHSPCSNFPKYACGSYHNISNEGNYPNDRIYLAQIADDLNNIKDIKLQATHKAKDFLESCQLHQNPKSILKSVDVFKDPANFKLARTIGILKASGIDTILRTHINILGEQRLRIIIAVDQDLFLSTAFSDREVRENLDLLEISQTDKATAERNINTFIHKGRAILTNMQASPEVSDDISVIKNFNWEEYLAELKRVRKLNNATIEFILQDISTLQKIIDLVQETDSQVLRLITAMEFMAEVIDTGCDIVVDYFRMPIFAEFYRLYFTPSDKKFNLDVLSEFEKSQSEIASKVDGIHGGVLVRVKEKKRIIENMHRILDPRTIDAEYADIHIEKDNFYQNYLVMAKFKIHKYLVTESSQDDFVEQYLLNILNPLNRMKPAFFHFASQGLYIWQLFFRENRPKYSYEKLRDCLDSQQDKYKLFEFNDFDYFDYVEQFSALKQTHSNFRRYWDHEYDPSHKLDNIFSQFHLTSDQAFFLNVAQRECLRLNDGKNIPFRVMLNMKELDAAFNCPPGSQLNIPDKCTI